jgi:phosphoglycolate phosphatase
MSLIDNYDCDGVLWHGDSPIPGAAEFINHLIQDLQKKVYFVTNASKKSREQFHQKFISLGFSAVQIEQCYPSGFFCAKFLKSRVNPPVENLVVIGEEGMKRELAKEGFNLITAPSFDGEFTEQMFRDMADSMPSNIDGVVCGFDGSFDYSKICFASLALQKNKNAFLCATNDDAFMKLGDYAMPGNGCLVNTLLYCLRSFSKDREYLVTGKPDPCIVEYIQSQSGITDKSKILMVGDRLDTDILLGINAGIDSCLVLTGCSTATESTTIIPTYVKNNVTELI